MSSLTLAEPPAPGLPEWIEPALQVKSGRDPLGLMTITQDRIMPVLVPGLLALSNRARYFTFHPFLIDEFERRELPPDDGALSDFIRLREFELACAVQLCPNGCGTKAAGALGTIAASSAVKNRSGDAISRRESVESHLGGYGTNYRSPLIDLGIVVPRGTLYGDEEERKATPVDVLRRDERASTLADAYRQAIAETAYYREWFVGDEPIPVEVLTDLARRGCLCRLVEFEDERSLIRSLFFDLPPGEQPAFVTRDVEQRRRSTTLFLRAVDRSAEIVGSDDQLRASIWEEFSEQPGRSGPLGETIAQWAALAVKDYWQDGLSVIFAELCRLGRASPQADGLSSSELDALIRGELLGTEPVAIEGSSTAIDPGAPTSTLVQAVESATSGLPLEAIRAAAVTSGSSAAALVLILETVRRLPQPDVAPEGWRQIGSQSSERQPSILLFAKLLETHLGKSLSVGDTLAWLVRRFVVGAHEQIAYGKLPDFTFRFRWEGGRLRFYPIGGDRFQTADIRRASLARLTEDVGLWERPETGPALSETGREFVRAVLG